MDPYDECYDIEEMKKLNASVLKYVVEVMEERHHEYFGELRECPIYCELIGCFPGWIIGNIFGGVIGIIVIVCVIVILIMKLNKNSVRRINAERNSFPTSRYY